MLILCNKPGIIHLLNFVMQGNYISSLSKPLLTRYSVFFWSQKHPNWHSMYERHIAKRTEFAVLGINDGGSNSSSTTQPLWALTSGVRGGQMHQGNPEMKKLLLSTLHSSGQKQT